MSERWKPSVTVAAIAAREVDGRPEFLLVEEETPEGLRLNNPAGHLDPGESPEQAAQRELQEEIGFKAGRLQKMAFFHTTPGFCDESMHAFRATGLVASKAQGDEDERIEVQAFTLSDLEAMIDRGEIREGKTLVAILLELRRVRPSA